LQALIVAKGLVKSVAIQGSFGKIAIKIYDIVNNPAAETAGR